jgi:tRNA-dihydrouridine synthase B
MHGRTRCQKFRGEANWDHIADLVEALDIPVIGNGDVVDGDSYLRMANHTRCHTVMIGRGAMGNPWIFREMQDAAQGREFQPPGLEEIFDVIRMHVDEISKRRGERYGSQLVRKHVVRYLRGFPGAAVMRRRLFDTDTGEDMLMALEEIKAEYAVETNGETI